MASTSDHPVPSKPTLGSFGTLRRFLPYLWPANEWGLRARVILALASLVAAKVAVVFVPIFYRDAIDALDMSQGSTALILPVGVILAYGAARFLSLAFGELRDALFAKVGQRAIRTIALQVFRHLHALSLGFHLSRQTGGLSRSIERGTKAIETLLRFSIFSIVPTVLELAMVFIILWKALDAWVALATVITVVVYITYTMLITEWRIKFRRIMNEEDSRANTRAIDSLLNYETVKYFGNEEHEARRFDVAMRGYERAAVQSHISLALLNIGQAIIISAGLIAVMLMTANGIISGTLTLGTFVMANTYLMQLYQPLGFFGFVYREIKQSLIDMEKLFDLMGEDAQVADVSHAKTLAVTGGDVSFEDVHFGYDERRPILKGVSFRIPAGKTVAVVGPSGSGKSTIGRLLYRFYDVDQGTIRIDGHDLREITQQSLRASIGVVPQDTVLFNETIYYNIAYGKPGVTPAEVEHAARTAHVHDFIMAMPDGYETLVGERGLKLSGGEKQRVAIARTVIKDPAILLLDEATSALDTHTEQEIQKNLREISRGRTTLCIAHRLSTVVDADEILVLDGGHIVERGRHGDLLALNDHYARMWRRQQESRDHGRDFPEGALVT
ncbi:MAG: ABC transporter ATP-binding protein/permease [Gammaproteobacteria bacterium]|nr:ABC transporter ATP-binding protein/permease [Gammaproteobacteria bacterium]MDX2459640.1 ABC transporter ATP-binding protein/permease [Gammaproteobacteria bacterium]